MASNLLLRLYDIKSRLERLEEAISRLRSSLLELEEARRLLEKGTARRVYRVFGQYILIELDASEAKSFVEEEIEAIQLQLKKLEEEREKLVKEAKRLEEQLGVRS